MADDKDKADEDQQEQESKPGASTIKIVIIAVLASVLLSAGVAGGVIYFMGGLGGDEVTAKADEAAEGEEEEQAVEEEEEEPQGPLQYFSMDPKFVVSFRDQRSARFMQFSLEVVTRDNNVMKLIELHMPPIRSSLLMLFGVQSYDTMVTREGKEKLLQDTVTDINQTLSQVSGDEITGVEAAYFNSFVIQ